MALHQAMPGLASDTCLDAEASQSAVAGFLSDPATYGQIEPVDVHTTHGSMVFLSSTHAYKMKRAVWYPYMDYATAARRKAMCAHELEVNRRAAPHLYESVRGIAPSSAGLQFCDADDARAIEWVVVMKRFDQDDLLEERRKAGRLPLPAMAAVGEAIAALHMTAEVTDRFGGVSGLRAVVDENVGMLREAEDVMPAELTDRYSDLSEQWLRRLRAKLGWRRHTGMVRRGHGDLHLNNICLTDGKPLLFDAIEFDDSFACLDTGFDLAFLLMDLDTHGLRHHANAVLNRYLERTRDYDLLHALPLFLATRAALRAHITIAKRRLHADDEKQSPAGLVRRALTYLSPPRPVLVAVGGLSGSGKSTIAALTAPSVGPAPGAVVLRTDVIRKAMFKVTDTTRLDGNAYDEATTTSVYKELNRLAAQALAAGHSVIADAVFGTEQERAAVALTARQASVPFKGIWLTAPRTLMEQRLAVRTSDASDANAAVLAKQWAAITAPANWFHVENARATPATDAVAAHIGSDLRGSS